VTENKVNTFNAENAEEKKENAENATASFFVGQKKAHVSNWIGFSAPLR
jgi:hypothetical protein